jgi:hypothetical protein
MKKFILTTIVLTCMLASFFGWQPKTTYAGFGVAYGGLDLFLIPCTCTAGYLNWHFFAPLYLNNPTPIAGALVAATTPVAYSTYYVRPGSWAKGFELPGAGICYIGVEPYCYPLPNYGLITPFTGVSPTI